MQWAGGGVSTNCVRFVGPLSRRSHRGSDFSCGSKAARLDTITSSLHHPSKRKGRLPLRCRAERRRQRSIFSYTLFPALQREGARTSFMHTPEQNVVVHVIGDEP